ncbi:DUF6304 family protein [Flavobacterium sp. '19STA2R22 D10 B1']|uniref:DUF6304 family protein n=1 Tax=Flavobacterium aerium TaxID=3037261 RepID=UPI00278BAF91|nr:DUF6304 family protein [Flavobacterium sp. '19STA2R22 D10 B1']
MHYSGIYKDDFGSVIISLENDFRNLSVEIDGVNFKGSEFTDLVLLEQEKYTSEQIARFTFLSTLMYGTNIIQETLCNCYFKIIVPQNLIEHSTNLTFSTDLTIECFIGNTRPKPQGGLDFEQIKVSLTINGKLFEGAGDVIEIALDVIHKQFEGQYNFKNCYGCMYGDYSIYGQSSFGTMRCYVNQKENYLKVKDKSEYEGLTSDFEMVQEIYSCHHYESRKKGIGYRG